MTMRATLYLLLGLLLTVLLSSCGPCCMRQKNQGADCQMRKGHSMMEPAAEYARKDLLYSCNCGPECKCNSVSVAPGNCACGKPLAWGHLVRVEGSDALLCTCKEGCQCKIDPHDPTKCGCGNPIKRISLKGSGLYFCNCGGSCSCNVVSAHPGECYCGMPLRKAE